MCAASEPAYAAPMKALLQLALAGAFVFVLVKWRRVWAGKAWHELSSEPESGIAGPLQNRVERVTQRVPF
jgi:hypothetical protein